MKKQMDTTNHRPGCLCEVCRMERRKMARAAAKEKTDEPLTSHALFGVDVWNPLDAGIKGVPLMVPAHDYNRVASNLADALSLALQYVPLDGHDADEIRRLERAATIPPNIESPKPVRPNP